MNHAAILSIAVKATGVLETQRDLRGLDRTARDAGDNMHKSASKGGRAFKALAGGATVAGVGIAVGMKKAIDAFEESRRIGRQTEAVIKSTGGAANITAKQVGALAMAISRKTGIDDEQIQKGANLLLTFKNIRNEAGRGKDIFNQTTQAAIDLSAAGFGSVESASKQLGKALNDPVKGMSALGRSGVTFSEEQKKAIAALMETGKAADRVKAQQLILKEVNSQVGGSAEAQATATDKLKVSLGNLQETVGSWLVPALDKASRFLLKLIEQAQAGEGVFGRVRDAFSGASSESGVLTTALEKAKSIFESVKTTIVGVIDVVTVLWKKFGDDLVGYLSGSVAAIMKIVDGLAQMLRGFVDLVAGVLTGDWSRAWDGIKGIFGGAWTAMVGILQGAWNTIKTAVNVSVQAVGSILGGAWEAIKSVASAGWNAIKGVITGVLGAVRDALSFWVGGWKTILSGAWEAIKTAASTAWDGIKTAITTPVGLAVAGVKTVLGAGSGLIGWLGDRVDDIAKVAEKFARPIINAFHGVKDIVSKVVDWFEKLIGLVKDAVSAIGKIKLPKIDLPDLNPIGGRGGGNVGPGASLNTGGVDKFNAIASRFGNVVTSGYRPGDDGWHGRNRARDYAGGNMLAFARFMAATFGGSLLELIHTPLGFGIKNGQKVGLGFWGSAVNADHFNHVHVALEKGGHITRSGWALVGEKGPELAHLPGGSTVYDSGQSMRALGSGGGPLFEQHFHGPVNFGDFDENSMAARLAWLLEA